jgi:LmbE family N-acetylglucosaminyl deacetylase
VPDVLAELPADVSLHPTYADITDQLERKITGINLYESQIRRLFDDVKAMAAAVRRHGRSVAELGGVPGTAERIWVSARR